MRFDGEAGRWIGFRPATGFSGKRSAQERTINWPQERQFELAKACHFVRILVSGTAGLRYGTKWVFRKSAHLELKNKGISNGQ